MKDMNLFGSASQGLSVAKNLNTPRRLYLETNNGTNIVELVFECKYTLVEGNSGIGKTYIYDNILQQDLLGLHLVSDFNHIIPVTPTMTADYLLAEVVNKTNALFVIDEDSTSLFNKTYAKKRSLFKNTSNYFCIISRDYTTDLPISCNCVWTLFKEIVAGKTYISNKPYYNTKERVLLETLRSIPKVVEDVSQMIHGLCCKILLGV